MAKAQTEKKGKTSAVKKVKKQISEGKIFVQATFNNTIITATDLDGNVIAWASSGYVNFKGSRKSTPYAAQIAARDLVKKIQARGMKSLDIFVKGPGIGRESAVRAFGSSGFVIHSITDITPLPHNGCRPQKKRRV